MICEKKICTESKTILKKKPNFPSPIIIDYKTLMMIKTQTAHTYRCCCDGNHFFYYSQKKNLTRFPLYTQKKMMLNKYQPKKIISMT